MFLKRESYYPIPNSNHPLITWESNFSRPSGCANQAAILHEFPVGTANALLSRGLFQSVVHLLSPVKPATVATGVVDGH
jgi:hypothetical protein